MLLHPFYGVFAGHGVWQTYRATADIHLDRCDRGADRPADDA
jgi:hypothetical protein